VSFSTPRSTENKLRTVKPTLTKHSTRPIKIVVIG
jgi:hypothetical protein